MLVGLRRGASCLGASGGAAQDGTEAVQYDLVLPCAWQPPGKWASIAKKNVAPPKGNAKVTAGAGGGAAVAAAEMPAAEEETAPPAVEETAPPALEETAEEKIKRLEAQVEMLTKQRALEQAATAVAQRSDAPADAEVPPPKPKKGWGPIEKVPVMTNGFH